MSTRPGPLRRAWRAVFDPPPAGATADAPAQASLASELLTLRVRTIYATEPRPELVERSNRLRLFALSRLYARYLDRLAGAPTPRDLFGGMTTFTELAAQAAQLRAARPADGATAEVLARIERESTRIVREVFHPRRRAWIRAQAPVGHAAEMDERAVEQAAMAPADHARSPESGLETDIPGLDQLPELAEGPLAFVELGDPIPAHDDPAHELPPVDPDWLRSLFAANAAWDNELFADGQTTLSGHDPMLLPASIRAERRYPPLELSRRQELLLQGALELGTDIVALHTSLSLTGDVVTRISPHLPAEHRPLFLTLHKDGTANAMAHWSSLIQALQALLGGVLGAVGRRAGGD